VISIWMQEFLVTYEFILTSPGYAHRFFLGNLCNFLLWIYAVTNFKPKSLKHLQICKTIFFCAVWHDFFPPIVHSKQIQSPGFLYSEKKKNRNKRSFYFVNESLQLTLVAYLSILCLSLCPLPQFEVYNFT